MAAINLDVGANTRRAERDIQKLVNRSYNINLNTKGDQPLGRITGKVNEFTKSLDASNARVIAFGASAGIIFGIQRAFDAMARSVIDVQKSLQDINVILNVSTSQLQKFGGELFNIAKNTGQSFQAVAEAATEFSRQGLSLEETLKRTNNALVLSRLSGLDAAKSVEALTAAVNSFASQAVTTTEIVNKFANVDAAFAVSSADLANAIARVGSSAAQSGVSLNELIAIVTSAQQTTARGGAVIGNSFKTIFTRLQRTQVVDLLENLGVNTKDSSGQIKTTINLLTDLAKVYDQLGTLQQAEVAEKVGGVFQINILKAALADLGKEYSIYNNALNVAASSTDEAIRRNQELNKTYAAQLNALQENARQLGSNVGERVFGPSFDRVVGGTNKILGGVNESDGEGAGAVLAKGILDGLGQVLAGPGLALIGGILIKLFKDLSKFATGSLQQLLGLNTASGQQRDLQQSISQILAKNPQLIEMALKGEQGLNTAANQLLANLQKQTIELQKQAQVAGQIAKVFYGAGVRVQGGVPTAPTPGKPGKAAGFVPNFAKNLQPGVSPGEAMGEVLGAKDVGYKVRPEEVYKRRIHKGDGSSMMATVSEAETVFDKTVEGTKGTWVIPPTGLAKGFVPNFASVENIAKLNKRVAERLSLSQSPRGDGRLQNEDLVNLSGRAFQQKQFPIDPKETFKKYEARVLQQSKALLGKNYRNGEELRFVTSAAVDGYNISQRGDETAIDLLEVKGGKNWNPTSVLNKFLRAVPENYLSKNPLDIFKKARDKITVGATLVTPYTKEKAKPTQERLLKKRSIKAAAGFIPNFAKEITDLGNTVTAPQLKGKVSSLIHPAITTGLSKKEATATYLGKKYKGLVTTAGINQAEIEGGVPDLEKNLGNLMLREANEFGRAIGAQNFLKTPEELPNYGGVKGAVGTAFEGGVTTLLRQSLQKSSQTAGIDFTQNRMTPKMKKLFHGAPGTYEAKYSPDLANDVLAKMLRAANVGGVKVAKSGAGFGASQALRAEALKNLQGQNLRRGPKLEKAIKEEMARISRSRGLASGFIPNFASGSSAETNRGIPVSQIRAHFDGLGNPIAVTNKKDEPNGLKDAIGREKQGIGIPGKLSAFSGFVPNFAQDAAPSGIGQTVTALIAELGILAFVLKDFTRDVQTSQTDIITSGNAQLEADRTRLGEVQKGTPEYEKLNKSINKTEKYLKGTGPKIDAWASGVSNALIFAGPIIAQTIKNAIGTETKGARAAGSAVEGAGNALSAGAFAATLAQSNKGKIGGAVAILVGIFSALNGPLKEFGTDLPELSAAAKEASEKLSAFGNISQTVQTTFEQIQDLAGKGQVKEAGRVQQSLFADTASQIADPNLRGKVITAVQNKDAEALRKALEENTQKLTEANDIASRKEAVEAGIQKLQTLQPGVLDIAGSFFKSSGDLQKDKDKRKEKEKEAAAPIFNRAIGNIAGGDNAQVNLDALLKLRTEAEGSLEGYKNALKQLGYSEEQIVKLVDEEAITRKPFVALLNDSIETQRNVINNTGTGNKVIDTINKTLGKIRENYSKYSQAIAIGTKNLITSNAEIKNALQRIKVNAETNAAELSQSFFGENAVFAQDSQQKSASSGLAKIDSDFETSIRTSIAESLGSVVGVIQQSSDKRFGAAATLGAEGDNKSGQQVAQENFDKLPGVIAQISKDFELPGLEKLLQIPENLKDFQGFNIGEITKSITAKFPESPDEIKKVVDQLTDTNRTLLEQKRIQTEQKILLAQNKLSEFTKAIVSAVTNSFGGFQGFISDDTSLLDKFDENTAGLKILGKPGESKESQIEFGRNMGGLLKELEKIAGRPIAPQLEGGGQNPVISTIIKAQALSIKDNLDYIFSDLTNFEGSQDIADAFRKTLTDQLELKPDASNEQIATKTAEAQTNAATATGEINKSILEGARAQFEKSNPELAEALRNVPAAFMDAQSFSLLEIQRSNDFLQQIAANTSINDNGTDSKERAAAREKAVNDARARVQKSQEESKAIPSASRGYLPRFAAGSPMMVNSSEFLVKNAKKEMQDMRKLGYSGEPMLLSAASGFNPNTDAITNPLQQKAFDKMGIFSNAKPIAAKGYMPNFAKGYMPNFAEGSLPGATKASPELLRKFLEVVNDPKELEKFLAPFEKDFQMLGRSGFSSPLENYNKSTPVDISPYGGKRGSGSEFSKFSWKELEELGLFSASVETNRMGKEQVFFRNKGDYIKAFEEITEVARKFEVDELAKIAAAKTTKAAGATPKAAGATPKIVLEDIDYKDNLEWDEASNTAKKVSGKTSLISLADRDIVLTKVNGVEIPFYRSTGKAGKAGVAAGKFYPVFGIGEDGWINKGSTSQINDFYGSPELKRIAEQLDEELAGQKGKPVGAKAVSPSINRGLSEIGVSPVENSLPDTPKKLQENVQKVLGKINENNKIPRPSAGIAAGGAGAKTNVTKAVEEAGKQIPKAANSSSATTFSKAGLVSGTDDAAIAAARAGIGTKVAETGAGVVAETAENTVEKTVTGSVGKGFAKKLGGGLLKYGSSLYAGASALSAIGRKRMEDPDAGAGDLIKAGLKGATIGDQESLGFDSPLAAFGYDFAARGGKMAYDSLKGKGGNASTTATESLTGSVESAAKKISPRAFFNDLVEKAGGPTAKISSFSKTVIDSLKSGGSMADVKMEDLKRLAPDQLKDLLESGLLDPRKFDLSKIAKFGGNLVKGVGLGIVTDIAGNYAKDKIIESSGLDKNSYIGGVIDELSKSGIAAGSGIVGGGGLVGTIIGLGAETLGKVGRLGSASIELMRQSNINAVDAKKQELLDKEAQKAGYANQLEQLQAKLAKAKSERPAKGPKQKQTKSQLQEARYAFSTAYNKNWPLDQNSETEFNNLLTTKPEDESIDAFVKRIQSQAPKVRDYKIKEAVKKYKSNPLGPITYDDAMARASKVPAKPVEAPKPISDNGVIKRYKTPEEAKLASKLARDKNFDKMSPEMQDFYRQNDFQDELAKKIGGIATGGSQEEVNKYLEEKAKSVGMGERFTKDYLEPEQRKNSRSPVPSKTNPYKLIGGKGSKPAMQINKKTGMADYVPKATRATPDEIIKRETSPNSQEELRKLMPPQYFQRLGKNYVDQISEAYSEQISKTKDPAKAMALRKKADAIRSLYNQGIDSRSVDMDKFNELEGIYKSMEQRPMSPEEYKKTPEYRNRIFSDNPMKAPKNAANGYMPMAVKDSIMREEMSGISKSDMVFQQRPELQGVNNIQGLGLFSRNELGKERQAVAAKGYIPNFANALENKNSSSVSLGGINLNINSSSAGTDYSSLGERVQALLENEIPKMMGELEKQQSAIANFNSTKATMDNMIKTSPSANRSQPPPSFTKQKTLVA